MKPRLFIFDGDKNYLGEILPDLIMLERKELSTLTGKYLLHVGFNPPTADAIGSTLKELPCGIYCTTAFRDALPGDAWEFSSNIYVERDQIDIVMLFGAPLKGFEIDPSSQDLINQMSGYQKFEDQTASEVTASEVNEFGEIENIPLLNLPFSTRILNTFKRENISHLSDLLEWTRPELLRLRGVGRAGINEINGFLTWKGLSLGKENNPNLKLAPISRNKIISSGGVGVEDVLLKSQRFSVRTMNVFNNNSIIYLSDLVKYTEAELLRTPNFGVLSLVEIKEFLLERGLLLNDETTVFEKVEEKVELSTLDSSIFENDLINEIDKIEDERMRDILLCRSGLEGKFTLELLGERYKVSRERIRQIESKALSKILRFKSDHLYNWYRILREIRLKSENPIEVDRIPRVDQRFYSSSCEPSTIISFLIYWSNKIIAPPPDEQVFVVEYKDRKYLSSNDQDSLGKIASFIIDSLKNSKKMELNILKAECFRYAQSNQISSFNLIWEDELKNCLVSRLDGENPHFIKYVPRSQTERAVQLIIEHVNLADGPITNQEIERIVKEKTPVSFNSVSNVLKNSEEIFPSSHGSWMTVKHLKISETDREKIVVFAEKKLENDEFAQVHSREIEDGLRNQISPHLNDFAIAAVLRRFSDLTYLGRSVFASQNSKVSKRYFIHEAMVNVLRANNKPLSAASLLEQTRDLVSVSDTYQVQIKSPIISLGRNLFGLDYWEQ